MASRWRLSLSLSAPTLEAEDVRKYARAVICSLGCFSLRDLACIAFYYRKRLHSLSSGAGALLYPAGRIIRA